MDSIAVRGGRAVGVQLVDGTRVEAATTVVAAGTQSGRLIAPVIDPFELMPMFADLGFFKATERARGAGFHSVVRTPNRAFACGLHLVPLDNGREYLGATNMVVRTPQAKAVLGDVHFLSDCAMRQLDEEIYHHHVPSTESANRPVALDGFPHVGWTRTPGLYLLTGTYRDGFRNAPLLAEHVADQLNGGEGTIGDLFSAPRRSIVTRTVDESIEDFVQHRMAAWFEGSAQTPANMSAVALSQILREQAVMFYDKLGVDVGLGPDAPHAYPRLAAQRRYGSRAAVPARVPVTSRRTCP